ncbi:MAG: 5'-nucleotidase C-terminal domain-containing protein [Halobacteriaceae archaeon]
MDEPLTTLEETTPRTEAARFGGESRAGNFVADAVRAATGADVGLFPAGSIRTGPPLEGEVTVGDIVGVIPFDDELRELSVTGRALRDVLADAAVPHAQERGWVHLHLSGVHARWTDDHTLETVTIDGDPLQLTDQYSVGTMGYLVSTEDFEPLSEETVVRKHKSAIDALLDHARRGGFADAERTGRIRKQSEED